MEVDLSLERKKGLFGFLRKNKNTEEELPPPPIYPGFIKKMKLKKQKNLSTSIKNLVDPDNLSKKLQIKEEELINEEARLRSFESELNEKSVKLNRFEDELKQEEKKLNSLSYCVAKDREATDEARVKIENIIEEIEERELKIKDQKKEIQKKEKDLEELEQYLLIKEADFAKHKSELNELKEDLLKEKSSIEDELSIIKIQHDSFLKDTEFRTNELKELIKLIKNENTFLNVMIKNDISLLKNKETEILELVSNLRKQERILHGEERNIASQIKEPSTSVSFPKKPELKSVIQKIAKPVEFKIEDKLSGLIEESKNLLNNNDINEAQIKIRAANKLLLQLLNFDLKRKLKYEVQEVETSIKIAMLD